jgi:hypothetical protein
MFSTKETEYKILIAKPGRKTPLGRPRNRRKYNIKMNLKKTEWKCVQQIPLARSCGDGTELRDLYKTGNFWLAKPSIRFSRTINCWARLWSVTIIQITPRNSQEVETRRFRTLLHNYTGIIMTPFTLGIPMTFQWISAPFNKVSN